MMEESKHHLEPLVQDGDSQKKELEEKINLMWTTIEDLKKKVLEERELLRKEKRENEKLMEQQVKLRKQLSVFHLPHCPAYNSPPCPIHSVKPLPSSKSDGSRLIKHHSEQGILFTGRQGGDNAGRPSYEEFLRSLDPNSSTSFENLFEDVNLPGEDKTSDFTLLMSRQWQSRLAGVTKETKKNGLCFPINQENVDDSRCETSEP